MDIDTCIEIEHIYARKRDEVTPLADRGNLESLGNKALHEKSINIPVADYKFADKKKFYMGFTDGSGKERSDTEIVEFRRLAAERDDFGETGIVKQTDEIIAMFVRFLGSCGLIAEGA